MPAARLWTAEEDAVIREAVECGERSADAADELGVPWTAVLRRAKQLGLKFPMGPKPDPALRAAVLSAVADGCVNCRQVADKIGRNREFVKQLARELVRRGLLRVVGASRFTRLELTEAW